MGRAIALMSFGHTPRRMVTSYSPRVTRRLKAITTMILRRSSTTFCAMRLQRASLSSLPTAPGAPPTPTPWSCRRLTPTARASRLRLHPLLSPAPCLSSRQRRCKRTVRRCPQASLWQVSARRRRLPLSRPNPRVRPLATLAAFLISFRAAVTVLAQPMTARQASLTGFAKFSTIATAK